MLGLLVCLPGLMLAQATAQSAEIRWNELATLIAGQQVTIPLPGGGAVAGEVLSVRDDSLMLDVSRTSDAARYPKDKPRFRAPGSPRSGSPNMAAPAGACSAPWWARCSASSRAPKSRCTGRTRKQPESPLFPPWPSVSPSADISPAARSTGAHAPCESHRIASTGPPMNAEKRG